MKAEPVVSVQFHESVQIKLRATGFNRSNEHTHIDTKAPKFKGLFEMVTCEHGIVIRATGQKDSVQTVPWSNIRCFTTVANETWSEEQYEAEKEAAAAKVA